MNAKTVIVAAIVLCGLTSYTPAQDMDSAPPVVIKTIPEAGSKNVPPGEYEIIITFSKDMTDGSWSWSTAWENSTPEMIGKPHYEADHRTCVVKVKLEPGQTYGWWLNSQKFHGFRDQQNHAAVPYLLTFATDGAGKAQDNPALPVDLTAEYTTTAAQFDQITDFPAWKSVPRGTQVFDQVPLLIGGMFCLWGDGCAHRKPPVIFPEAVTGIGVNRKFESLYVYHGSFYQSPEGTPVCDVVFRYEDGSAVTNQMLYGNDFLDWRVNDKGRTPIKPSGPNSKLAWSGGSFSPDKIEPSSFFLTEIKNPRPEMNVASVDLFSCKSRTAAVIMAMTTGRSGLMQENLGEWIWKGDSQNLEQVPPAFILRTSTLPATWTPFDMFGTNRYLARGKSLQNLITTVWSQKNSALHLTFTTKLPDDKFDVIVTAEPNWADKLQAEIDDRYHLIEQIENHGGSDVVVIKNAGG